MPGSVDVDPSVFLGRAGRARALSNAVAMSGGSRNIHTPQLAQISGSIHRRFDAVTQMTPIWQTVRAQEEAAPEHGGTSWTADNALTGFRVAAYRNHQRVPGPRIVQQRGQLWAVVPPSDMCSVQIRSYACIVERLHLHIDVLLRGRPAHSPRQSRRSRVI